VALGEVSTPCLGVIAMTNNLIPFQFQSTQLRVLIDDSGNPWFIAKDICDILGYRNAPQAISQHCREGGISKRYTPTPSGEQEMLCIDEGNLYRLMLRSHKEVAKLLEAEVCDKILPAIRKTGRYEAAPVIETISPQQHKQLTDAIDGVLRDGAWALRYCNGATDHIANRLRVTFNIQTLRDLPVSQFDAALIVINSLKPYAVEYRNFCAELNNAFIRDVLGGGMPWTAWIKRTIGVELPRRPDWKKIAQELVAKKIAKGDAK
jgi:prophage antirepressor-like protein